MKPFLQRLLAILLLSASAARGQQDSPEALAAAAQTLGDDLLAAARAGDAAKVSALIDSTYKMHPSLGSAGAARMLDDLARRRELTAFTVLHDQLKQTNLGKDWKPGDELLAALARDGRTDFLDVLLARGLDPDRLTRTAGDADPKTQEWVTRRTGEVAKQRADVELLGKAAKDDDLPAIGHLLDAGVDVNAVDKADNTPLLEAVHKDRLDAARLLLARGALVDKPRYPGWDYTPLCLAQSALMAELLKRAGANLHAKLWHRDVNILVYVAEFGKPEVVAWFLQQGLDPKMVGDNDENLLFGLKDAGTAALLLDAGVDPNHVSKFGRTPLATARSAAVVQTLIDHGAKVTGLKEPIIEQMMSGFASGDAIETAIKAGADHDPAMLQKALIGAAHADRDEVARVLLKYGAKANEPGPWSSESDTLLPLQVCTIFGSEKTAKALLDAGADPNGGKTPGALLKNAMQNGHKKVAELLRKAGAKGVSDLSFAVAMRDEAGTRQLLAAAPSYAENNAFWDDVLPSAARVGDLATVRAALEKGAPLQIGERIDDAYSAAAGEGQHEVLAVLLATRKPGDDPAGLRLALWEAVWNSHPYGNQRPTPDFEECVRQLLAAGAPVNGAKDADNLIVAAVFSRNPGGNPGVVEMLVKAGADPNPELDMRENGKKHLLDEVQQSCKEGGCSVPTADTVAKLCRLTAAPASNPR